MQRKYLAFTLIEVLVVVAIIALLAAILFPVFALARGTTRRAACQSNLKQIGLSILQYTQDYDERLPNAWVGKDGENQTGGWVFYSTFGEEGTPAVFDIARGSVQPYLKSTAVFVCPADGNGRSRGNSYAINSCTLTSIGNGFASSKSLAAIEDTSRLILLSEEATISSTTDDGYQLIDVNTFSDRHLGSSNVAFVDGHVKWYGVDKIINDQLQTGGSGTTCP